MAKRLKRGQRLKALHEGQIEDFIFAKYKDQRRIYAVLIRKENDIWIAKELILLNRKNIR